VADAGLDGAYVSVPPPLFGEDARLLNDGLEVLVGGALRGLAYLPIADPPAAVVEARQRRGGVWAGYVIASSAGARTLADPELDPLWTALAESDAFVFVHPTEAPDARLARFGLDNLLGYPYETSFAAACLVFADVPARFPAIRFCLAHAGGATAMLAGRWQRAYDARRAGIPSLRLEPRQALARIAVDSLAHSDAALALARRTFAEVLPGSDWPFPMGQTLRAA
jgi:aminocarboxymuconate-semialdehyde decarboxylase